MGYDEYWLLSNIAYIVHKYYDDNIFVDKYSK